MKFDLFEVASGIGGGFLSSLCCLGPVLFVLFGFGSLSAALLLGAYKYYFLLFGAVFFIVATYLHLKRASKQNVCDFATFRRNWKQVAFGGISFLSVYFLSVYVVVPLLAPVVFDSNNPSGTLSQNAELHKATFAVGGLTCQGCAAGVQSRLSGMEGVANAKVSFDSKKATVVFDAKKTSVKEIFTAFEPYNAVVLGEEVVA
ncbi:MAG: heavy-metal-associated domain-containing protein [Candidatus Micrarchaeia archaeon]